MYTSYGLLKNLVYQIGDQIGYNLIIINHLFNQKNAKSYRENISVAEARFH